MGKSLGSLVRRSQNRTIWFVTGMACYKLYQSHCLEGRQQRHWVLRGYDCDVPHHLGIKMSAYIYTYTLNDNNVF
jgi:hypothetical protein